MATKFQETVAMDLKFYNGKIILHLIDHCTRLSASALIPDKNPETIIKYTFKIWISVYGSAEKFLTDNGGEFANEKFIDMCEQLGIVVKTTAAESPWSNGLVERHNLVLAEMLDKVLEDTKCNIEIALAWCINAKNSLSNVHGFSPYQLAIGSNPKLPTVITDDLPALTNQPATKILSDNLQALHKAREAFMASENSERIRRAMSHNIRTTGDVKYLTGDSVLYKRTSSREWHGPGKVLGQDGQQVLVKHGSIYVRVHPCRLQFASVPNLPSKDENRACSSQQKQLHPPTAQGNHASYSSDSDDEPVTPVIEGRKLRSHSHRNELPSPNNDENNFAHPDEGRNEPEYDSDHISNDEEQFALDGFSELFRTNDHIEEPFHHLEKQSSGTINVSDSEPDESIPSSSNTDNQLPPIHTDTDTSELDSTLIPQSTADETKVRPNTQIRYRDTPDSQWSTAKTINRAGKAKGKYSACWNIETSDGSVRNIDLATIPEWEIAEKPNHESSPKPVAFTSNEEFQQHDILISKANMMCSRPRNQNCSSGLTTKSSPRLMIMENIASPSDG